MLLRWLEVLAFVLIAIFFATQIFWPMWRGTRLFPIFRGRQRQLEHQIAATREEAIELGLDQRLKEEKERVSRLRSEGGDQDSTSAPGS